MNGVSQRLGGFFYKGYSEESLGLFRVYFGSLLFLYHIPQFATLFAIDPFGASFHYTDPIWYFELLGIDRTIPWLSLLAGLLLFASTLSMTVGKWTRTSIIVVLICIFYLKGVRDSAAGDVHHRYVVLVQILFFLLLSRCGEAATGRAPGKSGGAAGVGGELAHSGCPSLRGFLLLLRLGRQASRLRLGLVLRRRGQAAGAVDRSLRALGPVR